MNSLKPIKERSNMNEQKTEQTPATEQKVETAPAPAPEPKVKLAAGLFKPFTLGSSLKQSQTGNVITNVKVSTDYEKIMQENSKNQQLTSEQLEKLSQKK